MSLLAKLREACAELEAHHEDPWHTKVEAAVRGKDAVSTAALLDLLRVPATTGTARRLAAVMRNLNFIPIKSRRLMPGGRAGNTVTRGWARPVRAMKSSPTTTRAGGTGSSTHFSWNMSRVFVHACKETAERRDQEKVRHRCFKRRCITQL